MSLAKKKAAPTDAKPSVNPFDNKNKSTEVQNLNGNQVSAHGNTTDGNDAGSGVNNIRSNPKGNNPMSVDRSRKGPGKQGN